VPAAEVLPEPPEAGEAEPPEPLEPLESDPPEALPELPESAFAVAEEESPAATEPDRESVR
jgi:hypothetical protein